MTEDTHASQRPIREPSVLDYIRSRLSFGRAPAVEIPAPVRGPVPSEAVRGEMQQSPTRAGAVTRAVSGLPWRSFSALGLALAAQAMLEPPGRSSSAAVVTYSLGLGMLLWAALRGEWDLPARPAEQSVTDPLSYRRIPFIVSLPLVMLAFLFMGGNLFTIGNLALWIAALAFMVYALWLPDRNRPSIWRRAAAWISRPGWEIRFDRWTLLMIAAAALVLFFRLYHLQQTPAEPFSDHAEKLLDILDVSRGQTHIFFSRNTGREALQMYWTFLVLSVFGTGFSFLSLKLGTALLGLMTLPYVYLLGKEVGGRRLGLLAVIMMGVAYWPNVVSRVGLRFPLYPLFVAPLMYHLLRGLRTRNRNDFILAGLFLGLGLHGYSPFRIMPALVLAALGLYVLHAQSKGARRLAALWLVIIALVALVVFVPLFRYATEHPDSFSYRAYSRLTGIEQPLSAPWGMVFLSNTWKALTMFNVDNGGIWVHSLPNRPALDVTAAALFLIGVVLVAVRYGREQHWQDLFLLASIPILLLPSILSLAFPDENPSLNRTAGAMIPAFLLAAMALDGFITVVSRSGRQGWLAYPIAIGLLWVSAGQNYDLVFRQYDANFRGNAWNSSEMGEVIKQFGSVYGGTQHAWVIPFPHWVDTRLVGVWAGVPDRDFAMWTESLPETLPFSGPKLFLARASTTSPDLNDEAAIDALRELYPQGSLSLHKSKVADDAHDFWIYFVPALSNP